MAQPATRVVGRRLGGFLIDLVLLSVISTALFFALATKNAIPKLNGSGNRVQPYFDVTVNGNLWFVQGGTATLWLVLVVAVLVGLAVVLQSLAGATPGKMLVGVRVVNAQGQHAGPIANLVRLLGWIADGLPWFFLWGLCGFVTALNAKGNRRVGDMWAGTYVVRRQAVGVPVVVAGLAAAPAMPGPVPAATTDGPARDAFGNPIATSTAVMPVAAASAPSASGLPSAPVGATPADWYPDPTGKARLRYWNGGAWTDHTAP